MVPPGLLSPKNRIKKSSYNENYYFSLKHNETDTFYPSRCVFPIHYCHIPEDLTQPEKFY